MPSRFFCLLQRTRDEVLPSPPGAGGGAGGGGPTGLGRRLSAARPQSPNDTPSRRAVRTTSPATGTRLMSVIASPSGTLRTV